MKVDSGQFLWWEVGNFSEPGGLSIWCHCSLAGLVGVKKGS